MKTYEIFILCVTLIAAISFISATILFGNTINSQVNYLEMKSKANAEKINSVIGETNPDSIHPSGNLEYLVSYKNGTCISWKFYDNLNLTPTKTTVSTLGGCGV